MRNASPTAEQELEEMFEKYDGDFVAVCKALVREWDDEIAGIEERRANERAEWERLGLNLKVMERQGKKAKPKRSNKQKPEPEIVEVQVHLATLIEEQEKERHDALVSAPCFSR
jgi:hypothetical protein